MTGDSPAPFVYRATGGSAIGAQHCTNCPKPLGAPCGLSCEAHYARLQEERKADGCIVVDFPDLPGSG